MKIPSDKKLIELYCYVPSDECLSLLDFLKKELPIGVRLEDVVLTESHYCDGYDPEGKDTHHSLHIGYLISKEVHERSVRKRKIEKERNELDELERKISEKRSRLNTLRKGRRND